MDVGMAAGQEECGPSVKRTPGVGQDDRQAWKIDRHVVDRHRIGEYVPGRWKDRRPGVKHHRDSARLAFPIDVGELRQIGTIRIRREELMRRMDLDHPDPQIQNAARFRSRVSFMQRIDRADGQQSMAMGAREIGDPVVDLAGEAHHLGRHVVDAAGALHSLGIEIPEHTGG